jgi:hypothetical protein
VRPGKCRTTALRNLGFTHAPAIIADYTGIRLPDWELLPYDVAAIQAYFTSDSVVTLSRRFFCVTKSGNGHESSWLNDGSRANCVQPVRK